MQPDCQHTAVYTGSKTSQLFLQVQLSQQSSEDQKLLQLFTTSPLPRLVTVVSIIPHSCVTLLHLLSIVSEHPRILSWIKYWNDIVSRQHLISYVTTVQCLVCPHSAPPQLLSGGRGVHTSPWPAAGSGGCWWGSTCSPPRGRAGRSPR